MRKKFLLMILILSLFSSMGGGYLYGQNESDGVIDTESELRAALTAGGDVVLQGDITVSETIEILSGTRVALDLNGKAITSGKIYPINNNGDLTINDTKGTGAIRGLGIRNGYPANTRANYAAKLTINGGAYENVYPDEGAALFNEGRAYIKAGSFHGQNYAIYNAATLEIAGNSNNYIHIEGYNAAIVYSTFVEISYAEISGPLQKENGGSYEESNVTFYQARIGDAADWTSYKTFAEALTAASSMTGDVTIDILEKVTMNSSLSGSYSSINFVGKDTDSEIYLDVQGYITATGKNVAFENLTLSKSQGGFITNAGFMNVAFGVYDVPQVTYKNCVFANGAYAGTGVVTYTGCTFYRSHEKYGLWAYGDVDVTVDGGKFADYRGIKMYAEGAAKTVDLTVKNVDFSAVTDKPAIVLTYGESVTLEDNTYSDTGVFELDLDGAPNGTVVRSDVAPTCKNDNGACGVLVNDKIYTTVAQAAEVAEKGDEVTLLYSTSDEVVFNIGVNLTLADGVEADNVSVAIPVAKIGEKEYPSIDEAFAAATEGQTITLLKDATPALTSQRAITKASVIDLGNKTLTLTEDDLYFGTTTFKNGTIVVDPSVNASTAVFWMFANQTLTFDDVDIIATGVTGTYLIGINGDTGAAVNLVNGSSITIENESIAGLSVVICDNGTGNIVKINNSTINVNKVEGRFYLGGVNGSIAVENCDIDLNGVKEGFYLRAGQSLNITGNSTVDITLNETEGRYGINLTDVNAEYNVAETSIVNATVYQPTAIAQIGDVKYTTLQEAVNAVKNGETIKLLENITENVTLTEKVGLYYTIDGDSKTMNGSIVVKALSDTNDNRRITIKNVKFLDEDNNNSVTFIKSNDSNHYPRLTVDGCTFTGSGYEEDIDQDVAINLKSADDAIIQNCTGTGLHSFLQNTSGWNLTVDKVTVTDSKSGFSLGTVQGVTVKNCKVEEAAGYGIRLDADTYNNNAVIESCTVKAFIPVVVRKVNTTSNITFQGTNTMTQTNEDGLWCAIGKGEYETNGKMPEAPATGRVKVTLKDAGLDAEGIYGNFVPVAKVGEDEYDNLEAAFKAVTTENNAVDILKDITIDYAWDCRYTGSKFTVPVTINGNGKTIKFTASVNDNNYQAPFRFEADATVKNLNIDLSKTTDTRFRAISSKGNLTVEGCNFIGKNATDNCRAIIFGEGAGANVGNLEISVKNTVFTNWRRGITDNENGQDVKTVTVTGNTLTNAAVYVSAKENVTFTGNTVTDAYVNIRSYTANNTLDVTATGNTLKANTENNYNYISARGTVNAQEDFKVQSYGTLTNAYTSGTGYWGECGGNAKESFVFKFYNDGTYMGYTSLNDVGNIIDGSVYVSWNIKLDAETNTDVYWTMYWEIIPTLAMQPNRVEQWVDGVKVAECVVEPNWSDRIFPVVAAVTNENGVILSYVNGTEGFTLQDALNAGGNITIIRDIALTDGVTVPADKTVVLDLNGKTISQTKEQTTGYQMILNDGNLTIKDSSNPSTGKISYTDSGNGGEYISDVIYNRATLVIDGGTIENLSSATVATNGYPHAVDTYSGIRDTYVEINGGTIYCAEYSAVRMFCVSATNKADLVINGGTIKGAIDMQNGTKVAALGTLTINDGTFETTKNDNNIRFANWNGGATEYGISAEIKGGSFNGGITTQYVPAAANWNKGIISGGTFAKDMTEYCAPGFKVEENGDGTYGVVPFEEQEYVIDANGEIKTFADAIAKAKEDGVDIVTYIIKGAATLETGYSHGIVDFGGVAGYITIQGGSDNTRGTAEDSFTITGGGVPDIKGVTFKDLTFYDEGDYLTTANEFMYQNFIDCKFENVTFEDGIRLSGDNVVKDCIFNANTTDEYAIWLDEGTFEMTGSNVTAGNDAYGLLKSDEVDNITISNNTFQYLGKVNKEALNVKGATIIANDNTFIDCAKGVVPVDKVNYTETGEEITDAIIADDNTIIIYVAKIGNTKYQSFAEAVAAAQDGETITLLWAEGKAPIAMNASLYGGKTITITGTATVDWTKDNLFIGRGGEGNGKVIFDGADITSYAKPTVASTGFHVSGSKATDNNTNDGVLVIKNSKIEVDYLINRNEVIVDGNSTLTVYGGIYTHGRNANESSDGTAKTATLTIESGSTVVVVNENGMGVGGESNGVMTVKGTYMANNLTVSSIGLVNVNGGNVKVDAKLTNNGTVYVTGVSNLDATVTGDGWFYMNGVSLDTDTELLGAKVGFINGTNNIVGSTIKDGWFSVGIGNNDAAAKAAVFAEANGIALGNVTVNVSDNATIYTSTDAAYTGWVGSAYSADKDDNKYILNITNSLARFGYMHVSKDGELNATGHSNNQYEYAGNSVDFYAGTFINNGNVTLNGVEAWAQYTKISVDHADAVLNITNGTKYEANCTTGNVNANTFLYYKAGTVNVDATSSVNIEKATTLVEGAVLNIASDKVIAKGAVTGNGTINLTDLDAKFTAQEGLTVNNGVEGNTDYGVTYVNGAYQFAQYVAQIGEAKYLTLKEAVDAVANNGTITLIADETFTENNSTNSSGTWYEGIYYTGAKSFTIDLGEYTIGQDGSVNDYLLLFKNDGDNDNTITLKNGTIDAGATAYCAICTSTTSTKQITINTEDVNIINSNEYGSTIKIRGGAVLNVKEGTVITGKDSYLGIESSASTVNIYEGAEIYMNGTSSYNGCLVGVGGNGTINVYGGKGAGKSGGFIAMTSGGKINVYDGEWIANTDGTISNDNKGVLIAQNDKNTYPSAGQSIVNVTGGIFKGGYNCYGNAVGDAQINISGGNFNANPEYPKDYVIEGFAVETLSNGTYNVIPTSGTQTRELEAEWYWFSTYVDLNANGQNSLDIFKSAFVGEDNEVKVRQIKNQNGYVSYNSAYDIWVSDGGLLSITNTGMYMINMKESHTLELTGDFAERDLKIILNTGWNWIGYPVNEEINLTDALSELEPSTGDMIKSQTKSALWTGTKWKVENGFDRMIPGEGYKYLRKSSATKFSYSTDVKPTSKSDDRSEEYHWIANANQYPGNMTMIAMLSVDNEIVNDNYEVAAFANGECRGSARPIYDEDLNAYILILTIQGEEVEELTFKYYDVNYGTEYELNNRINYSDDAIVGSFEEPYMFNLGILNIDETSVDQISIYPNPTTTGKEINLQAMCDKVEVFNALGVKVAEYTNVDSIDAIETAGIYVIRVTIDDNARNCRLIVK